MAVVGIVREEELGRLLAAGRAAADGHGSVIFLAGRDGSGKSFLLDQFVTALGDANVDVVQLACHVAGGTANPLGPFIEGLRALTNEHRRGARAKRIVEILGKLAPLLEVIPVGGPIASKVVESGAGVYAATRHEQPQTELAGDVARVFQRAALETPLVVIVDDAQWIDPSSTEVIAQLSATAPAHPLLLVVAYHTDRVEETDPLVLVRAETVGRGLAGVIALSDLTADGVKSFLLDRYGSVPGRRLAEWLHDRTDGNPRFLSQYLDRLEEAGILCRDGEAWTLNGTIDGEPGAWSVSGRLAETQTPRNLLELLGPRVARLGDDELSLLQTGAVQGRRFLSTVLVRVLEREEDEILHRLGRLAESRHMIEAEGVEGWWSDRSAQYTFDPGLLQEVLYGRYKDPYERRRRHAKVALALEALVADYDPPPRPALLEIAWHYEQAGKPLEAAAKLVEVADSTFAEGADRETGIHAARALALIQKVVPQQSAGDAQTNARRLLVRAILLLLIGGELSWTAYSASAEAERLVELAEEGERTAKDLGDEKLRANALYASAFVHAICGNLVDALPLYQDALDTARAAQDPLAEFAILANYGFHLDNVDLHKGLKLLQEAHELLLGDALIGQLDDRQRASQTALIESRLGVAAFDLGRYGEALDLLTRSSIALRQFRNHDESAWCLAFLAQVHTAVGLYEAGEATIQDALGMFADDSRPLGVRGYLYSLLGRLYLEWDPAEKRDAARGALLHAREEAKAAGYRTTMPFPEIFWAALLFEEGTPEKLREADGVLGAVTSFGWERGEITARSLRAQVALAEGRTDRALELSTQAVTPLEKRGNVVPTVRAEEIFFTHARVLAAAKQERAEHYFEEAARVVRGKLDSLQDPAQRKSYRRRVWLSREILEARPRGSSSPTIAVTD